MKTLIVDDGWQTEDRSLGYAYCGTWEVAPGKIPDMGQFVNGVQMFSVPLSGVLQLTLRSHEKVEMIRRNI